MPRFTVWIARSSAAAMDGSRLPDIQPDSRLRTRQQRPVSDVQLRNQASGGARQASTTVCRHLMA